MKPRNYIKFCSSCGALMGKRTKIDFYDEWTGRPVFEYTFSCPNKRWYKIGHADLITVPTFEDKEGL